MQFQQNENTNREKVAKDTSIPFYTFPSDKNSLYGKKGINRNICNSWESVLMQIEKKSRNIHSSFSIHLEKEFGKIYAILGKM